MIDTDSRRKSFVYVLFIGMFYPHTRGSTTARLSPYARGSVHGDLADFTAIGADSAQTGGWRTWTWL